MKQGRWERRSAERPAEIAAAALTEFAQRGFAAARMADIASVAGLSKAALYVYYPTKADLFRAVLTQYAVPRLGGIETAAGSELPFAAVLDLILERLVSIIEQPELRRLVRMVIAESGNFPELAALWRETVVDPAVMAITKLLMRAQATGEVRLGEPRLMALTVMGPLLLGVIWREVMEPTGGDPLDLFALAREHRSMLHAGLLQSHPKHEG
jgi:AcrR family transcriptional regulator